MTIQQLEYIIAVDNYRHFVKAAEACRVTQPTLSMMIQKLEDELEVKIFDRMTQPVQPTEIGKKSSIRHDCLFINLIRLRSLFTTKKMF